MHCLYFLIHSICHSISGHLSTLAGCTWPFQSVITIFLFTALSEHCIDRCWQGEVQMWRVLSSAIARIRFYTMSPAWKIDIKAIIWMLYSCQSRRTFCLMLSTLCDPLKARIKIPDWIFETRVYFFLSGYFKIKSLLSFCYFRNIIPTFWWDKPLWTAISYCWQKGLGCLPKKGRYINI